MKLAFYCLAAVLFAGLGSALPFSRAQVEVPSRPAEREQVVYVNANRLVRLHPAWRALIEMDSTLAEVDPASREVVSHMSLPGQGWRRNRQEPRPRTDRRALELELQQEAMDTLRRQEVDMKRGLAMRVDANRKAMARRAETELAPRIQEIEASSEAMAKALDEQYAPQRLNAQLRESILRVTAKSPAVNAEAAAAKANAASSELKRIDDARRADKERVADAARAKIDALRKTEAAKAADWVKDYERTEAARIEQAVSDSEDRLCRDLGPGELDTARSRNAAGGVIPTAGRIGSAGSSGGEVGLGGLRDSVSAVRRRIEADVVRAVSEMGRHDGVRVTFQPKPGVRDATDKFAGLMQRQGWSVSGPVLSVARGR